MALNIKNPEVDALARRLANATGESITEVVLRALRERLQRAVNRLMYGERDDPYAVLSRLGRRLDANLGPEAVLPAVVETVAQTLKLPYVAIALHSDEQDQVVALEVRFPLGRECLLVVAAGRVQPHD